MPAIRQLRYIVLLVVALILVAKAAQVAMTPDFYLALQIVGAAVIGNVVVQALLITLALVGLVSLCACAWDKADRDYRRRTAERSEPKQNDNGRKAA